MVEKLSTRKSVEKQKNKYRILYAHKRYIILNHLLSVVRFTRHQRVLLNKCSFFSLSNAFFFFLKVLFIKYFTYTKRYA